MKKVAIWTIIVVALVVSIDLLVGWGMNKYMTICHLKGDYRSVDHLLNHPDDELIVLGSSVALNSINAKKMQNRLGVKSYNGGSNGQEMPYIQTLLEILAPDSKGKTFILGIIDQNLTDVGMGERYTFLAPYYGKGFTPIDKRLEKLTDHNDLFLKSALYRYNTAWFRIFLYQFYEPGKKGENGFIAKDLPTYYPKRIYYKNDLKITRERAKQLDSIVSICKQNDIRLILALTPQYSTRNIQTTLETYLRKRASDGEFELWYDTNLEAITADSTLFYDNRHLNYKGAEVYTDIIIGRLRK